MLAAESLSIGTHVAALIVSCMLLMGALLDGKVRERIYRCFFALILLNLAGLLAELTMGSLLIAGWPPSGAAVRALDFISYLIAPLQNVAFTLYLYEYLETKTKPSKAPFILSGVLTAISAVTIIWAQINGLFGGFDEGLAYRRGELNAVYYITSAALPAVFIYIALRYGRGLRRRERLALLSYPLIILISYAVEGMFPDVWVAYLGVSLILSVIYINIQGELKQQLERKDAQLAEQRIAIMLSQIQPHFLYNALNTIGDLCVTDPPLAQETVFEFADYLRVNMDSLSISGLVPFEKELDHVKTYLSLEQKRFMDRLSVEYDIETSDFHLPPLTVQPIVENAVLHGITVRRSMGTVLIRTRKVAAGVEITVADDGAGFDLSALPDSGKTHLGIENVRRRLESMCGGSLRVDSAPGEGTRVTILIPREEGQYR